MGKNYERNAPWRKARKAGEKPGGPGIKDLHRGRDGRSPREEVREAWVSRAGRKAKGRRK